jgi:transketolase N-terminal domain/subunit
MTIDAEILAARTRIAELVRNFQLNEADYLAPAYNETQARTDFITPLLEAFGWDVHNVAGLPMAFREVIEEATVEVGVEKLGDMLVPISQSSPHPRNTIPPCSQPA